MSEQGLIRQLFDGPLDIVGDVHGEIAALRALLEKLEYRPDGSHPEGRRLVFVGDLCDRGPDSPAVVNLVRPIVEAGRAQCVVGNHELNLLRREEKDGNHWFFPGDHSKHEKKFGRCEQVAPEEARAITAFFLTMPVALERPDLRVVHAAWRAAEIAACRAQSGNVLDVYEKFDRRLRESPEGPLLEAASDAEKQEHHDAIRNEQARPPFLRKIADYDVFYQMRNPVRVLTSGVERVATRQFYAGGKWRFVERERWWEDYQDLTPVIFGHYWRWWDPNSHEKFSKGEPNLFANVQPLGWQKNKDGREVAFCIDYSAGKRFDERRRGPSGPFESRLGALRWPERDYVFDDDACRRGPSHAGRPGPVDN